MSLPLGPSVPRRGNAFSRWLGRAVLWCMGWKLQGAIPDFPKMILIGAPHTSNMDGVVSFAALTALGLRAGTLVKESAFRGVTGALLRWLGAQPIDRNSPKGVVEQTIDAFNSRRSFVLLLAPEGTRAAAPEWKRGFYHVARGARVPVLPAAIDYRRKRITFGQPLHIGGDYEADLRLLLRFYGEYSAPRHAHRLSKPLCEALGLEWRSQSKPLD